MVVNQDHYINRVFHDARRARPHRRGVRHAPTSCVAARILVDPADPDDLAAVNALQDQLGLEARRPQPFVHARLRHESRRDPERAARASPRGLTASSTPSARGGRRPGPPPDRHRRRLGRTARAGGGLRGRRPRPAGRRVRAHRPRRARRRVLVDLGLQRRRVSSSRTTATPTASTTSPRPATTTASSPSASAAARRPTELPADHGRLELPSASTGPAPRSSTAPGRSPRSKRSDERGIPSGTFPNTGAPEGALARRRTRAPRASGGRRSRGPCEPVRRCREPPP